MSDKSTDKAATEPLELSRPYVASDVPGKGVEVTIEANEEERRALCDRFGLMDLASLTARFRLRPLAGGPIFSASGRLRAEVTQECAVTLDPVFQVVESDVDVEYAPESEESIDLDLTLEDEDPPEPILHGIIDLGELTAQQLALALDPYPRSEGARLDDVVEALPKGRRRDVEADAPPDNPFSALASLKTDKE